MKRNGFAQIIILLILAVLVSIGYFAYKNRLFKFGSQVEILNQSPSPTSTRNPFENWKTYKGENYQVSYPFDWYKEIVNNSLVYFDYGLAKDKTDERVTIDCPKDPVYKFPPNPSDWQANDGGYKLKFYKEITLNNESAIRYVWANEGWGTLYTILPNHDNSLVCKISTSIGANENDFESAIKSKSIYNQILSTFKFTQVSNEPKSISQSYDITIPTSWNGKYIKTISKDGSCDRYNFDGKTDDYLLFAICRMTSSEWDALQKSTDPHTEVELAKNSFYVYYYIFSLDDPYGGQEGIDYGNMATNLQSIIKTFKLLE